MHDPLPTTPPSTVVDKSALLCAPLPPVLTTRTLADHGLVTVLVLGTTGTHTLEQASTRAGVLATLTLTTTTTVRVVARVHGQTTDLWPLAQPAVTAGLGDRALLVLLATRCISEVCLGRNALLPALYSLGHHTNSGNTGGVKTTDLARLELDEHGTGLLEALAVIAHGAAELENLGTTHSVTVVVVVGDDLAESACRAAELHTAIRRSGQVVNVGSGRNQREGEDVSRLDGDGTEETKRTGGGRVDRVDNVGSLGRVDPALHETLGDTSTERLDSVASTQTVRSEDIRPTGLDLVALQARLSVSTGKRGLNLGKDGAVGSRHARLASSGGTTAVEQGNVATASRVVLDAHHVVSSGLEAVKVDNTETLLVSTANTTVHNATSAVASTVTPACNREITQGLALVQMRVEGLNEMTETLKTDVS